MKRFELLEPASVAEACVLLSRHGEEAKILGGGTALVKLMKKRLVHPAYVVDLKGIRSLRFLREEGGELRIGALTTLRELETHSLVRERFAPVAAMVHLIGSVQIRNVGTLAGNLCLADPAGDPAPLLMALGARLKIAGLSSSRILPMEEFFLDFYTTALQGDEILEEVRVPAPSPGMGISYLKHTLRAAFDLGVVNVATALTLRDGTCQDLRVFLGGVSTTPQRARATEELLKGRRIDAPLLEGASEAAAAACDPLQDVRASAEYRREMVRVLVGRGIRQALARAQGRLES